MNLRTKDKSKNRGNDVRFSHFFLVLSRLKSQCILEKAGTKHLLKYHVSLKGYATKFEFLV